MRSHTKWVGGPLVIALLALASEPLDDLWGTVFGSWEAAIAEVAWAVGDVPEDEVEGAQFGREVDLTLNDDGAAWCVMPVRADAYVEVELVSGGRNAELTVWEVADSAVAGQYEGSAWGRRNETRTRLRPEEAGYILVRVRDRGGERVTVSAHDPTREWEGQPSEVVEVAQAAWELQLDPEAIELASVGDTIEGFIAEGQSAWHVVDLPEGPARVMLESEDFDTVLEVWEVADTGLGESHYDDDSWYEMNSYLHLPAAGPRRLLIQVRAFGEGRSGGYTLHLPDPSVAVDAVQEVMERLQGDLPFDPGEAEMVELGVRTSGFLSSGGESWFIYELGPATRVNIDLTSDDFDTVVETWRVPVGARSIGSMTSNDDGGSGRNSRLSLTTSPNTVLLVKVRAFGNSSGGRFSLYVR
jgi:hypothetical protein